MAQAGILACRWGPPIAPERFLGDGMEDDGGDDDDHADEGAEDEPEQLEEDVKDEKAGKADVDDGEEQEPGNDDSKVDVDAKFAVKALECFVTKRHTVS